MKIFSLVLAMFAVVGLQAATTVTLHEKDIKKIDAAIADPQNIYTKMIATICKNCAEKEYKTFEDVYQMVRNEVKVLGVDSPYYTEERLEERAVAISKILADSRPTLRKGAFVLASQKPGVYDIGMYLVWKEHGLDDAGLYKALLDRLVMFHATVDHTMALRAVTRIIELGATASGITTQKQDLQKLNRIYSPKVLKDKDKWEPLCSQVRTAMETY